MNLDEGAAFPCEKCGVLCCFNCGGDDQCDSCLEQEEAAFDAAAEEAEPEETTEAAEAAQQPPGTAPEAEDARSRERGSEGSS